MIDALRRWAAGALLLALVACSQAPSPAANPVKAPSSGPALWRLTDADSEIWLFGTVHVLPPDLVWRTPKIDDAFANADVVYFETPTDAAAQQEVARAVAAGGRNAPGVTLASLLAAEDAQRLTRVAKSLNIDPNALAPLRPWLVALQVSLAAIVKEGHDPNSGVERVLEAEAARLGKPVRYFETPESQIRILSDMPDASGVRFLTATLRQVEEDRDSIDAMDAAWAKGDVARLADLLNDDISEAGPEVYAALLTRRNANWTRDIDTLMKGKGRVFVAVGAAHLVGPDGVPAMLRAKGYVVEGP